MVTKKTKETQTQTEAPKETQTQTEAPTQITTPGLQSHTPIKSRSFVT